MSHPIIIVTYAGMEHFIPDSINHLNTSWPEHGEIYVISDNINSQHFNCKKIYRSDSKLNWVEILYKGLLEFKKDFQDIQTVYLMLEDLIPLEKINTQTISIQEKIFNRENWKWLYFPHYKNDFEFELSLEGELFIETPNDWLYYSQIGVSLVSVNYFITLCEVAMNKGIRTPWDFEFIRSGQKHYISSYNWPTVRDGYSRQKYVNYDAIKFLTNGKLKQKLLINYILQLPQKKLKQLISIFKKIMFKTFNATK